RHVHSTAAAYHDPYTLSLHDALPIYRVGCHHQFIAMEPRKQLLRHVLVPRGTPLCLVQPLSLPFRSQGRPDHSNHFNKKRGSARDRKSTRLNSSHVAISYAVFCLKKK